MFRFSGGALTFVPWHFIHHVACMALLCDALHRLMNASGN
jgi:hypothetical protein